MARCPAESVGRAGEEFEQEGPAVVFGLAEAVELFALAAGFGVLTGVRRRDLAPTEVLAPVFAAVSISIIPV
ncbi:hypothetical protein [Caulobacter endophyticus]|uniref:hypothetical protein n=1 Tax=Caulobacter endophyticus TaxID=2172652 RepID=UPI0011B1C807|nr:hypothetical protein [Caulobacter endophyticus]